MVSVEDHLYHTTEMLEALDRIAPTLLACTTVCVLDEAGPDTTGAVARWLDRYDRLQVAARVDARNVPAARSGRVASLDPACLAEPSRFARAIASLLLPGGVLVQDIHLATLRFVPPDRWWESIYAAATIRGMFADRQPAVRFISNKRGYGATFGRELIDAGFDPREVMDKSELEQVIVPSIVRDVDARFPLGLSSAAGAPVVPVAADEASRRELDSRFDLVDWEVSGRVELGGRLLAAPITFRAGSNEGLTWQMLIADRLSGGPGVPVLDIGRRLAAAGAERAEMSNLAARHIHALRARLAEGGAIVTANHAYRLEDRAVVARVRRRT